MLVGVSGSGKSTWAKNYIKDHPNTEIISSDAIRLELFGDENSQIDNKKVFDVYYKRANDLLYEGKDIILDSTNVSFKDRKRIFTDLKEAWVKAIVFNTPREECIKRDQERGRSVGVGVIDKMISRFVCPQYYEGFYRIEYINFNKFDESKMIELKNRMYRFNQKNPHHKYSLGIHCDKSLSYLENIEDLWVSDDIKLAANWHDVGKLFTQTIDGNGVAHYYNHDNIGTYYLMTHTEILDIEWPNKYKEKDLPGILYSDLTEILFYVNWHMRAHKDLRGEKAKSKYIKIFGSERYWKLIEFANCDIKASGTFEGNEETK